MRFFALIALVFTMLAGPVMAQSGDGDGFAPNVTLVTDGKTAPTRPLMYVDGSQGSLADFKGNVLVVTLWQERCPFCVAEMPKLNRLNAEMKAEGVQVVALGMDQSIGTITAHLARSGLSNLRPIMDVEKFNGTILSVENFERMSIATPTSFIVDRNGIVVAKVWGLVDWDGEAARGYLRQLAAG